MKLENGTHTKMSAGLPKCHWNWCKTILSSIKEKVAKNTHFVANVNGQKKKELQSKFYAKIEDISVYNFAKCCGGELEYLYKVQPKKRNIEQEVQVFEELVNQYNDALHVDLKEYTNDIRYNILVARIRILESASGLNGKFSAEVKNILKSIGIKLTDNKEKNIALMNGKIATFLRELETLKAELNKKAEVNENLTTLENFSRVLTAISTYYKMYLDMRTLSVYEYCSYYRMYQVEVKELQKQKSKIENGKRKN